MLFELSFSHNGGARFRLRTIAPTHRTPFPARWTDEFRQKTAASLVYSLWIFSFRHGRWAYSKMSLGAIHFPGQCRPFSGTHGRLQYLRSLQPTPKTAKEITLFHPGISMPVDGQSLTPKDTVMEKHGFRYDGRNNTTCGKDGLSYQTRSPAQQSRFRAAASAQTSATTTSTPTRSFKPDDTWKHYCR